VFDHHRKLLSPTTTVVLAESELFFVAIKQLCSLLTLFTLLIHAIQAADDTTADVVRNWYFLARQLDALKAGRTDADFSAHSIASFN